MVQRSRRFFHSAASGYVLVGSLALLNLVTVPFALNILGKELFGLCMAVVQAITFMGIFELGVGPSVARFIADYKDDTGNASYCSLFKSVLAAGLVRGALLMGVAWMLANWIRLLFKIPDALGGAFCTLLLINVGVTALSYLLNPFFQLLYAHQRIDLINYSSIAANVAATGALLLALYKGAGIYAYAISAWTVFAVNNSLVVLSAYRLRIIPSLARGRVSFAALKPLMGYAANLVFISMGVQLITFAPTVLVSRILGLGALADWTVGIRIVTLAQQLVARVPSASEPAFWEMYVRGEIPRMKFRLAQVARVATTIASLAGGGIVAANSPFVSVWTSGKVVWPWYYNIGCAFWLLLSAISLTWNTLPGITKRLGVMKYVYLGEGFLMVLPAFLGLRISGLFWVPWWLVCGIVCCRCVHGACRLRADLGVGLRETLTRAAGYLLLFGSSACLGVIAYLAFEGRSPAIHVALSGALYAATACPVAYFFGLPAEARSRLAALLIRSR